MIYFFIGTKAQFIKMAPVMVEMRNRGIKFRYIDSGQHAAITRSLRRVFSIPEPDIMLRSDETDISTFHSALAWYLKHLFRIIFRKRWLKKRVFPVGGICLIHGDTLSTLMGLQMARAAGLKVAHLEAGLRSYRFGDPFPEELIRIYCMKKAQILFAPSEEAAKNLLHMKIKGKVIKTNGNTVSDAIRLMEKARSNILIPKSPYALATCHRLETITNKKRLTSIVQLINRVAEQIRVVFVMHKPTKKHLERSGLDGRLSPMVDRMEMLDYGDFLSLLKSARFVLTEGYQRRIGLTFNEL